MRSAWPYMPGEEPVIRVAAVASACLENRQLLSHELVSTYTVLSNQRILKKQKTCTVSRRVSQHREGVLFWHISLSKMTGLLYTPHRRHFVCFCDAINAAFRCPRLAFGLSIGYERASVSSKIYLFLFFMILYDDQGDHPPSNGWRISIQRLVHLHRIIASQMPMIAFRNNLYAMYRSACNGSNRASRFSGLPAERLRAPTPPLPLPSCSARRVPRYRQLLF